MSQNPWAEMAGLMDSRMIGHVQGQAKDSWLSSELGTMTSNLGLKLDRFKHVIEDYLVADYLTLAKPDMTTTETDGAHADPIGGTHSHKVITPKQLLPLQAGDRVVVIPVNDGQDFVIVARVIPRR